MKRLCSICARGGSKGVKGKNLREILGNPILSYSIEQAIESNLFDAIAVSSDSEDILNVAKKYDSVITIKRPDYLATDEAPKVPVIQHCAEEVEKLTGISFDTFVDLDCTSPLRNINDIRNVVKIIESESCRNVITAAPARRSPYFNLVELGVDGFVNLSKAHSTQIVRRQDAPKCFDMNASIYAWKREYFFDTKSVFSGETKLYIMPEDRSIDIDSELDFKIVKLIMESRNEA